MDREYAYALPEVAISYRDRQPVTDYVDVLSYVILNLSQAWIQTAGVVSESAYQLASYSIPWTTISGWRQFLTCHNPRFGLLDLIGGRVNPHYEHADEYRESALRELREETEIPLDKIYNFELQGWYLNNQSRTVYPVYSPFVIYSSNSGAEGIYPKTLDEMKTLDSESATKRLLAVITQL